MKANQIKEHVRRSVNEFWNTGDMSMIPKLYHADYRGHDPSGMHEGNLAQFTSSCEQIFQAFSNIRVVIDELLVDGQYCTKRYHTSSVHTGTYMGIPATGNKIEFTGTNVYRFEGGKIAEIWANSDTLAFMQCMGIVPRFDEQELETKG